MILRSRFITTIAPAPDEGAARALLRDLREEFPDATHHCWAYVAGPPGSTTAIGMSDDGEPHGTAGRPMLTVLLHSGVGEIAAVVTRYYGGTKLGTGGLTRAYAGAVKALLEELPTERKVERTEASIVIGYPFVQGVQRILQEVEAVLLEERYGERVEYDVAVPVPAIARLERELADLTSGSALLLAEEPSLRESGGE